jgi:hypothetical protein
MVDNLNLLVEEYKTVVRLVLLQRLCSFHDVLLSSQLFFNHRAFEEWIFKYLAKLFVNGLPDLLMLDKGLLHSKPGDLLLSTLVYMFIILVCRISFGVFVIRILKELGCD